ncbi:hypothetical protein [Bacillus sp. T33-2]|uniref:hypothetical protein n=1 Tax=Bacillus sp. T33-2 TaxID=2054168 RepID=UPI000C759733|nr:hypothetical protein [Bacillus sp. T33-2]PLR97429.1 hypothetical protein CVD19_08035 [Bacillus sp. T33-2]
MKSVQDALYNWLTIKVVTDARPDDTAAKQTEDQFAQILEEEHSIESVDITKDDEMYYISYEQNGERISTRFPRELIEVLLQQINQEPEKYANYPEE